MSAVRRVAVIIPYYQSEPGILARALRGVAAQALPEGVALRVHIVDDASPHPAWSELAEHPELQALDFVVTAQANAGPGAARNTALDLALAEVGTEFVAFLDSDDTWRPAHVADAISALDAGYDFYCCDNVRPGTYDRFSEHIPLLANSGEKLAERSDLIDPDGPVRGFPGGALTDDIAESYVSHTSTVVVRAKAIGDLRFDPDLRSAGEDRMFWLSLAAAGARIAVSWRCNVDCGSGLNLFFSAYDWDSPNTLERIGCQLLFAEKLLRNSGTTVRSREFAISRAAATRRAYSFLFVRSLLKLRTPPFRTFRRLLKFDPVLPFRMLPLFVREVLSRQRAEGL
ncbi:glycosyltransferase [Rhodobacterales bacterium HKCCE2091]|nr:glycosyltransferase [Rhodobacterales bacterium HKCCE2091]